MMFLIVSPVILENNVMTEVLEHPQYRVLKVTTVQPLINSFLVNQDFTVLKDLLLR